MAAFFVHLVFLAGAGIALFFLWRRTRLLHDRWIDIAIAAGFAARAFLGQLLFWISYEKLPIAKAMQIGDGLWFFAMDALLYYPPARSAAHGGLWAILHVPRSVASVSFVQTLSVFFILFGEAASVAVLLNLFCFLGMAWLIVRWAAQDPRARAAARFAIAAIALSPALMVWSLQPLKDPMFLFLVVAFVAACAAWQRAWISGSRWWWRVGIAAAMCAAIYMIAGIRWYFAFAMLIASGAFLLLVVFRAPDRRALAAVSALALLIVLSRAFLLGGGPYVPVPVSAALSPGMTRAAADLPTSIAHDVESAREGFEHSGGATQIGMGRELARLDQAAGPTPPPSSRVRKHQHNLPPAPLSAEPMPSSRLGRFAAGTAALVVPSSIGRRAGVFQIGGGRNLWLFTDLDTLVFDLAAAVAIYWVMRSIRSASLRNPLFWLVAGLTVLIAFPLVYTVANFGTLFRLRDMVYIGLVLIPLALSTAPPRSQ